MFLARVLSLVSPARWAVAAAGMCAVTQHGPDLVRYLWTTSHAAVRCQGFSATQEMPLHLRAALVGCHERGRGGQNVHGERHGPASYLCCFVGCTIRCVSADSVSVALIWAVRGLHARCHWGGRRCEACWVSAKDNSQSNGNAVAVNTAQGRPVSLLRSFPLLSTALSILFFSEQGDLHFICWVTSPSCPDCSSGERLAQMRKHRRNLLEPIWESLWQGERAARCLSMAGLSVGDTGTGWVQALAPQLQWGIATTLIRSQL